MRMEEKTITTFKDFKRFVKIDDKELQEAARIYLESGGVMRIKFASEPILLYPSKKRLIKLIEEKNKLLEELTEQLEFWKKQYNEAKHYNLKLFFKKFKEPIYWKHLVKLILSPNYRKDALQAKLPAKLIADERWHAMVKMFVENEEYRKQLCMALKYSPAYWRSKKLAEYAEQIIRFRIEEYSKKIESIESKISETKLALKVFHKLLAWAT